MECPHGKFDPMIGCPQCVTERRAKGINSATTAIALRPGEDAKRKVR